MTGRWLINSVLLVLVLGLGSVIRHEVEQSSSLPELSGLAPAAVRLIELDRAGAPLIRLGATHSGWRMEQPLKADADPSKVEALSAVLRTPVHRSFPEGTAALGELGLAPPRIRLRLDSLELGFGDLDPITQSRYVATGGLVHLIDDRFYHLLIAQPLDWLSRRLLPQSFTPVFGRIDGTPLGSTALNALASLTAERIDPLTGEPSGSSLELEDSDGSQLRFRVSEDRLRWTSVDLRALYILKSPPELTLDPTAVDPTPDRPETTTAPPSPGQLGTEPQVQRPEPAPEEPAVVDHNDPFAPPTESELPVEPANQDDVILPGDTMLGPPPSVRLGPDGSESAGGKVPRHQPKMPTRLRGGANPGIPEGFGQDPFAPDPRPEGGATR